MAERQPLTSLLFIAFFSSFYSFMALLRLLYGVIVKGPTKMFAVQRRLNRPDLLDDPSFGVHSFARLKKIKLHYVAKGSESKPLMLMLHGFPEFWYSWRHQLKEFGGDYRAVAVDMRGYSESDKPRAVADYTAAELTNDIKELIQALGYEKCVLVSHDWGGAVAWSFTQLYPHMVDKLIVCNCPHSIAFRKFMSSSWKQFLMSWYMMFFQMPYLPETLLRSLDLKAFDGMMKSRKGGAKPGSFTDDDIEMYKFTFAQDGALTGPINYYRAAFQYKPGVDFPPGKIQVPSLLIWGDQDMALSTEMAEMSRDYVEDLRVEYVEGASHWVQMDEPQIVNKHIRQFLS